MTEINSKQIETRLQHIMAPYLGMDIIAAQWVKDITIEAQRVSVIIKRGYPAASDDADLITQIKTALAPVVGARTVDVQVGAHIVAHQVKPDLSMVPGIKNIIAVASGKGGVGKSTTAVNLALALQAEGATVGILDADIYGPSQPTMLGSIEKPHTDDQKHMIPIVRHGLQAMSIGYLVDDDTAMIWRGPMVSRALQQLLSETRWQNLDFLIVDLPPGTGDIQLTLVQKIPVTAAVIVTTPQDIALMDAQKALTMFRKVEVPVLGIIENMSTHICSQCGHEEALFGQGGGQQLSARYQVPLLGQLPLDKRIREQTDQGYPTVVASPASSLAKHYVDTAKKMAGELSKRARNYQIAMPKIVIEEH